jgi:hypothetical protein
MLLKCRQQVGPPWRRKKPSNINGWGLVARDRAHSGKRMGSQPARNWR